MNRSSAKARGGRRCPALFIGAAASGQGKTTVTAALARYHAREGRRVRVFKAGPDFLDPKILEVASGSVVFNLDCWMVGVDASRALLSQASRSADLILIEGAMGLYDGDPSGADLAKTIGKSGITALPPPVAFDVADPRPPTRALSGRTIAVARDVAFSFIYPANLDCLSDMGATLRFFSPLGDQVVPVADALYLPGGYPELHADRISRNARWQRSLAEFAAAGRPIVAECGGMMALVETLVTCDGMAHSMAGLLPGSVRMRQRLAGIGLQALQLPQGELRGHAFHYSEMETPFAPVARCVAYRHGAGEYCYRKGAITASYLHAYLPSNPPAVAGLFTRGMAGT